MKKDSIVNLSPSPASLIESLRDIGYSTETAIADVIDNSITARSTKIQLRFSWNSGAPWLAIIDDGYGMAQSELINAMRFGSMNPLETRSTDDLGRFGLGMKTASFSQCRCLTVLSKMEDQVSACQWDLEVIAKEANGDWKLGVLGSSTIQSHYVLGPLCHEYLDRVESGTIVLWENFDRVDELGSPKHKEKSFNSIIYDSRKHIELVFHRYLSPGPGGKRISISMNGDDLTGFNPFNPNHLATQELEQQQIRLNGEIIVVQPYILPHHNKVSKAEYKNYSGLGGYLHNQGFYIYRNRRLIIKGTWFRLIKKEELNKLIRIRVDIPNSIDHLWKINVKKSYASPPEAIKKELRQVIERIEVAGKKVFKQKGKNLSSGIENPVWNRKAVGGTIVYEVNREHPIISQLVENASPSQKELLKHLLKMIEGSFPIDLFFNDIASKPEQVGNPELDDTSFESLVDIFMKSWTSSGIREPEAVNHLLSTDPFASNKVLTEKILRKKGYVHV